MPWVRSAIDCASPNRSVPESCSGSARSPWCSKTWSTRRYSRSQRARGSTATTAVPAATARATTASDGSLTKIAAGARRVACCTSQASTSSSPTPSRKNTSAEPAPTARPRRTSSASISAADATGRSSPRGASTKRDHGGVQREQQLAEADARTSVMLSDSTSRTVDVCPIGQRFDGRRCETLMTWTPRRSPTCPLPANEPVHEYAPGSPERARLTAALSDSTRRPDRPAARHRRQAHDGRRRPHRRRPAAPAQRGARHADQRRPRRGHRRRRRGDRRQGRRGPPRRSTSAPRCSCAPPTCSPARGARRSPPPPCSASPRPPTRPRSTRRANSSTSGGSTSAFARQILAQQPISAPRRVEPHRLPPARGLRLRDHARSTSPPSRATCRPHPR